MNKGGIYNEIFNGQMLNLHTVCILKQVGVIPCKCFRINRLATFMMNKG